MNTIITWLESPAVERLGWVLIHSLWQLALLAGIYLLVRRLLWRSPAATRYLAACAIMVCMVLILPLTALLVNTRPQPAGVASHVTALPVTTSPRDRALSESEGPVPASSTVVPDVPMVQTDSAPPSEPLVIADRAATWKERLSEGLVPALPWVVLAWFAGVLALAVRQLGGWILLRRLCGSGTEPVDEILTGKLTMIARRLGVQRVVRLLSSVNVAVPSVIGHFKPVILFPASLISGLSPQQIEAILAHELAHIRRHDYLINLIQTTCETVLFYHPAVWWISREIRREREHCCDDLAVRVCGRVTYARTLAMLEEHRAPLPAAAMAATGGSLLQRIRRIVGQPAAARATRGTWLAGALVILTVCVLLPLSIATAYAVGKAAKPEFAKAEVEILIDAQGQPLADKPVAITLTDAAEIGELTAFFPRVGTGRKSSRAAGWKEGVTIEFHTSTGETVHVRVSRSDGLTVWSEGEGDWPVKGDFKAYVEKLRKRTLKHSIGIHLVTGSPKDVPRDKVPLADLTLADEALITQDDISQYDWESHTIRLKTQAAAERILYRKEPDGRWVVGESFVVVVDGQRLYRGAMLSGMSSFIPDEPMIHIGPGAGQWQPQLAIRIHPPTRDAPDLRGDARLKKALQDLLLMPKDAAPPVPGKQAESMRMEVELRALERQMEVELLTKTERHPAVIALHSRIATIRTRLAAAESKPSDPKPSTPSGPITAKAGGGEPVRAISNQVDPEIAPKDDRVSITGQVIGADGNQDMDTAWGKPVNGLQACLRWTPGVKRFEYGDTLKCEFVVRNTTDKPVEFEWIANGWHPLVLNGRVHLTSAILTNGIPDLRKATIEPHDERTVQLIQYVVRPAAYDAVFSPSSTLRIAPGEYLANAGLSGLETGPVEIEIAGEDTALAAPEAGGLATQPADATPIEPPWGEAAEGVQVRLTEGKGTWSSRSDWPHPLLSLSYEVKNEGGYILHLPENGLDHQVEVDGQWYEWVDPSLEAEEAGEIHDSKRGGTLLDFGPGGQHAGQKIEVAGNWRTIPKGKETEYAARRYGSGYVVREDDHGQELVLTPGRYQVRVGAVCPSARAPFHGVVRAVSNPVEVKIGATKIPNAVGVGIGDETNTTPQGEDRPINQEVKLDLRGDFAWTIGKLCSEASVKMEIPHCVGFTKGKDVDLASEEKPFSIVAVTLNAKKSGRFDLIPEFFLMRDGQQHRVCRGIRILSPKPDPRAAAFHPPRNASVWPGHSGDRISCKEGDSIVFELLFDHLWQGRQAELIVTSLVAVQREGKEDLLK